MRLIYIILPVCFFIIAYLCVAFVVWEVNAALMDESTRFLIIALGVPSAFIGFIIADNISDNNKENKEIK